MHSTVYQLGQKLVWYGINHGPVVWGSRTVDSRTEGAEQSVALL